MQVAKHGFVSGKVQGVWYRETAKKKAARLGLKGWVRNLSDGRVELVVVGEEDVVEIFCKWLWKGPILAKVKHVELHDIIKQSFPDFSVR